MAERRAQRLLPALFVLLPILGTAISSTPASGAVQKRGPRALRVGTYKGVKGKFKSIQAAVDAARPGDWILVGPGDYHERYDRRSPEPASEDGPPPAGRADHARRGSTSAG